jgi:hypothetical protein
MVFQSEIPSFLQKYVSFKGSVGFYPGFSGKRGFLIVTIYSFCYNRENFFEVSDDFPFFQS